MEEVVDEATVDEVVDESTVDEVCGAEESGLLGLEATWLELFAVDVDAATAVVDIC